MQKKINLPKTEAIEPTDPASDDADVEGHGLPNGPGELSPRLPSTGGELSPRLPSTGGELTEDDTAGH